MEAYFDRESNVADVSDKDVMKKIAYRYIKDNPPNRFTYRAFSTEGFMREDGGRSILDFDEKFPAAKDGEYAYAFSKIYSESDGMCCLSVTFHNPTEVYINGELAAKTNCLDEVVNEKRAFDFPVKKGYNTVFVKSKKNALGFCCKIGCYNPKWLPVNFYTAFEDNDGMLGWNYCGTFGDDVFDKAPAENSKIDERWLPKTEKNCSPDIFSGNKAVYALSFLECGESVEVELSCSFTGKIRIFVDGKELCNEREYVEVTAYLDCGLHRLSVKYTDYEYGSLPKLCTKNAKLMLPEYIRGVDGVWLYSFCDDDRLSNGFNEFCLLHDSEGSDFYRSAPNTYIRPVLEEPLFGKSNYPIGVVLYGLLTAGKHLGDKKITDYAHKHLEQCYLIHEYALWDTEKFGFACINHQLLSLSALDDCGAFGAAVLEDYLRYSYDDGAGALVDYIGEYILHKQERLENGMFYREMPGHHFQYTVWADDLYMSIPFLIRYAEYKNDGEIMEDALNQISCFKELLYMKDKQLMSHVYSLRHGKPTNIPWGRGNGWVLFTLSEVLRALPKFHEKYKEARDFFTLLAEGFLSMCGADGMLHQVLKDSKSYGEASCTAMCAAAFSRGVVLGVLPADPYLAAARKCVEALKKYCIDNEGNIYGVCVGSGYSFRPEYYRDELPWNVNDTHGTGIILIAIAETESVQRQN